MSVLQYRNVFKPIFRPQGVLLPPIQPCTAGKLATRGIHFCHFYVEARKLRNAISDRVVGALFGLLDKYVHVEQNPRASGYVLVGPFGSDPQVFVAIPWPRAEDPKWVRRGLWSPFTPVWLSGHKARSRDVRTRAQGAMVE